MDEIRVEIDLLDYPPDWPMLDRAISESWFLGRLKAAGIPVKGTLLFDGLESGALTRYEDAKRPGVWCFVWKPVVP